MYLEQTAPWARGKDEGGGVYLPDGVLADLPDGNLDKLGL